ncbi:uncharacterized protein LOC117134990 [Drosophila busckii]|uniref:uncharacterized protein LOC117134990 n=1 Tax=Drosophila busckii TaxID=30019 RepID=UPI001432EE8E|nr:uncharacterized protein LOC117134990 [Drosophila busckii]
MLIMELRKGWSTSLNFNGIRFRPGLIVIECRDDNTRDWLVSVVPKMAAVEGVQLKTCMGEQLLELEIVTVHLPRSSGEQEQTSPDPLKGQNTDLLPDTWTVLKYMETRGGKLVTLKERAQHRQCHPVGPSTAVAVPDEVNTVESDALAELEADADNASLEGLDLAGLQVGESEDGKSEDKQTLVSDSLDDSLAQEEGRKSKRAHFRKFCTNIEKTPPAARVLKAISNARGIQELCLKKSDGTFTENEEEKARLLLLTHFPYT